MKLAVYFDYACPFSYLGMTYLAQLLPSHAHIEPIWRPCEAHPRPESRVVMDENAPYWRRILVPKAKAAGVALNMPKGPLPYSDLAIQGLFFVMEQHGEIWAYHNAVYSAVFAQDQPIDDVAVLMDCAKAAGVDAEAFAAALGDGRFLGRLRAHNDDAWSQIEAVPYFILENGHRLGAKPSNIVAKEALDALLAGAIKTSQ